MNLKKYFRKLCFTKSLLGKPMLKVYGLIGFAMILTLAVAVNFNLVFFLRNRYASFKNNNSNINIWSLTTEWQIKLDFEKFSSMIILRNPNLFTTSYNL
uniref:Uncharacterized protein n=1 Tax=Heterorhabditis bacteriophora TaxID=37862 RepID=A0A1I7W906_HETBA